MAISQFEVTASTESSITIDWTVTQRYVYLWYGTDQATVSNATGTSGRKSVSTTSMGSSSSKSGTYNLTGLNSYTTYYLKLGNNSSTSTSGRTYSNVISASTGTPEILSSPTNLSSTASYLTANVSWNAVTNATGYVVYYKKSTDTSYQSTSSSTNNITLSSLTDSTIYTWYVIALGNGGQYRDSSQSNSDTFTTLSQTHVSTPTNLLSSTTLTKATLSWNAVTNATGYVVYYKESLESSFNNIGSDTNEVTITALTVNTTYDWYVIALGNGEEYGDSTQSNVLTFTTLDGSLLPAPTNLASTDISYGRATLAWDAVTNATGYKVSYRRGTTGDFATTTTLTNSVTLTGLLPGISYQWNVAAIGDDVSYAYSPASSNATFTTIFPLFPDEYKECAAEVGTEPLFGSYIDCATYDNLAMVCACNFRAPGQGGGTIVLRVSSSGELTSINLKPTILAETDGFGDWLTGLTCTVQPDGEFYIITITCAVLWYFGYDYTGFAILSDEPVNITGAEVLQSSTFNPNLTYPSPILKLTTPTNLSATNITSTGARLNWTGDENATSYKVEYRQNGQSNWIDADS